MAHPEPSPLKFLLAKTASGTQTLLLGVVWGLALTGKLVRSVERWANGEDGSDGEPVMWNALDHLATNRRYDADDNPNDGEDTNADAPFHPKESPAE